MASQVYYRFKAQPETSTIAFDGTGISVWELKKEILATSNFGKAADFDFSLVDPDTEQEYRNDEEMIPRASTVIARRLPAAKKGYGTALKYTVVEGAAAVAINTAQAIRGGKFGGRNMQLDLRGDRQRFDQADDQYQPKEQITSAVVGADEAQQLAAFQQAESANWKQNEEKLMGHKRYLNPRGPQGGAARSFGGTNKPLPRGYTCYRCGQPGHHIHDCPLHDDPNGTRQRVIRTMGIPKAFLQQIDKSEAGDGAMVDATGQFVRPLPDTASWQQHRAIAPNMSADEVQSSQPTDPDLTCPIDNKLLRNATLVPCCGTAFCYECIVNYLAKHANACPECETRIKSVASLKPDEERRKRVEGYVAEILRVSQEVAAKEEGEADSNGLEEGSRSSSMAPKAEEAKDESETGSTIGGTQRSLSVAGTSAARPIPPMKRPLDTIAASQQAQSQKLFQLMMLLANPQVVGHERAQLQAMLSSMSYVVNNVKGVYRPGVSPPSFAPIRPPVPLAAQQQQQPYGGGPQAHVPTGPRHAINSYTGAGVPTGPARNVGARGNNPFGLPQHPGVHQQPMALQHQQQPQAGYGGAHMYGGGGGIKRERPADFVTLGPSEKLARAE